MKAVILSAGQGRRLLPLTQSRPKCVLPIHGRPIILHQVDVLLAAGIERIVVILGHGAEGVEKILAAHPQHRRIRAIYNPFYAVADNLASCWLASPEMDSDFMLVNGDTLFEEALARRLIDSPRKPITLCVDEKPAYDDDDMRVRRNGSRLLRVGKDLSSTETDGESIGVSIFRDKGPARFRWALENAIRRTDGLKHWYLSVVNELAASGIVHSCLIKGLRWAEVDTKEDLVLASEIMSRRARVAGRD